MRIGTTRAIVRVVAAVGGAVVGQCRLADRHHRRLAGNRSGRITSNSSLQPGRMTVQSKIGFPPSPFDRWRGQLPSVLCRSKVRLLAMHSGGGLIERYEVGSLHLLGRSTRQGATGPRAIRKAVLRACTLAGHGVEHNLVAAQRRKVPCSATLDASVRFQASNPAGHALREGVISAKLSDLQARERSVNIFFKPFCSLIDTAIGPRSAIRLGHARGRIGAGPPIVGFLRRGQALIPRFLFEHLYEAAAASSPRSATRSPAGCRTGSCTILVVLELTPRRAEPLIGRCAVRQCRDSLGGR